jgi:outer membrane translocation and assembly module TamA
MIIKHKLIGVVVCVIVQICFIVVMGRAKETDKQMDYSKLSLNISKTYTVPQIRNTSNKLTPQAGFQLVVLELQGTAPEAMHIILQTKDFTAQIGSDEVIASGVGVKDQKEMLWAISGTTNHSFSVSSKLEWSEKKGGQFSFAVCFSLKKEIKNFKLRCGKTTIEAKILK